MKQSINYQMPCDPEAEATLLGQLMASTAVQVTEVRPLLGDALFYHERNKVVLRAILAAVDAGEQPDMSFVWRHVQADPAPVKPDMAALAEISTHNAHTALAIPQYIDLLAGYTARRNALQVAMKLATTAQSGSDDLQAVTASAVEALQTADGDDRSVVTLRDVLRDVDAVIADNCKGHTTRCTLTGFPYLDQRGGLQPGNLIVIAGATSQGKTAFALSMAANALRSGARIAFYSLEMTREQLAARLLAAEGESLNSLRLLTQPLRNEEMRDYNASAGRVWNYADRLYFDDRSNSNIDAILNGIRSLAVRRDIDGVVVDYLQILSVNQRGSQQTREQLMGDVARRLQNLAKDLCVWIVALSQINRNLDNPVPSIDRLRDSGQIAEAADIVMTVYRPEAYGRTYPKPFANVDPRGTAMIDVCKGRNIGVGRFIAGFDAQRTLFYALDQVPTLAGDAPQRAHTTDNLNPF